MTVVNLKSASDVSIYGGKAANLAQMLQAGLPVPGGFAVSLNAFTTSGSLSDQARSAIKELLDDTLYAVRSSALAEDAEGASWAGQFETFLDTKHEDVLEKIEACHNSAKARAHAYANEQAADASFEVAVVVQEMIKPEYAGVLFTKDPVTGKDQFVTEYVKGLGEELVSGRTDPKRLAWQPGEQVEAPFDIDQLTKLAQETEHVFGMPQDIEWAWANNKMWLVQARPITTTQTHGSGYYLGKPEDLFYWGPSRAQTLYMSDFMAAVEKFFTQTAADSALPDPPKTVVLFHDGKMVWLNNGTAFIDFTEKLFTAYESQHRFEDDYQNWLRVKHDPGRLLEAWGYTLFAEFSLYGAESVLAKRLARLEPNTRQEIWGAFTSPDNLTFLARIDEELQASGSSEELAEKYPWIQHGYSGTDLDALPYFQERLKILQDHKDNGHETKKDRATLADKYNLNEDEVTALNLTRQLAEFMDERKAWMMRTRRSITKPFANIQSGWAFKDGAAKPIDNDHVTELWQRYVNFKSSSSAVKGIVASNGGRHFINGEVVVVDSPTASVSDGKILVVPSTSPSYVPLMRKAKALITDHGGMMSHAAIVAREFNLPCIVGTKQATKVLQTGDKVIIDLVKGEISR